MSHTREELRAKSDRSLMLMCRRASISYGRMRPSKTRMINDLLALQSEISELATPSSKAKEEFDIETSPKKVRKPRKMEEEHGDVIIAKTNYNKFLTIDEGLLGNTTVDEPGPTGDGD